jgi:hypothetical protein
MRALPPRAARPTAVRTSFLVSTLAAARSRCRPFFSGVHRFGVARFALFLSDPFHTMLK